MRWTTLLPEGKKPLSVSSTGLTKTLVLRGPQPWGLMEDNSKKQISQGCFTTKTALVSTTLLAAFLTTGCAVKTGNENLGKMETNQIDQSIVKEKTTKSEIKQVLGDPDKTDFDNNGNEKWTYSHKRADAKVVNYVPVVNWFVQGTNDTIKTLVVLFNDNGVVKNYIVSDAKGETKGGLFQ